MIELLAGEKHKGESSKAMQACNDYLRMGAGRSLRQLARDYQKAPQNTTPTRSYDTIAKWSQAYDWVNRGGDYDKELEAKKNAEAEVVMQSGLALEHERVRLLKSMAGSLESRMLYEKSVKGETVELVDISVVSQLRGVLDDIAKETGGRVSKQEITGKDGGAIETIVLKPIRADIGESD